MIKAEGLRPHQHEWFYLSSKYYRDRYNILIRKVIYECMICGKTKYQTITLLEINKKEKLPKWIRLKNKIL